MLLLLLRPRVRHRLSLVTNRPMGKSYTLRRFRKFQVRLEVLVGC